MNRRAGGRLMYLGLVFAVLGLALGISNSVGGADPASIVLAVGQVLSGLFLSALGYRQRQQPDAPDDSAEPSG